MGQVSRIQVIARLPSEVSGWAMALTKDSRLRAGGLVLDTLGVISQ